MSRLPAKFARPELPIADIKVGEDRKRGLGDIKRLADSIAEIGLQNAITVTPEGVLVSGLHRLEACRSLGWERVPVFVVQLDALQRELAEIDENLIRNELTVLQRSEHLQRRMAIYEMLHPETKHGSAGGKAGGRGRPKLANDISSSAIPSFTEDTAAKLGVSQRSVQRDIQIAKSLDDDTKAAVRGTPLENNKKGLLSLAREKAPEARKAMLQGVAANDVASKGSKVAGPKSQKAKEVAERNKQIAHLVKQGFCDQEIADKLGCQRHMVQHAKTAMGLRPKRHPLRGIIDNAQEFADGISDSFAALGESWKDATIEQIDDAIFALDALSRAARDLSKRLKKEAEEKKNDGEAHESTG